MKYNKDDVVERIKSQVYKLRYRRSEGFGDKSLLSSCLINEVKYLFTLLDKETQNDILDKTWLDE